MKLGWHSNTTRVLMYTALMLHVIMITRALSIMGGLQDINATFDAEYIKLTRILDLTSSVRHAEEAVHGCSHKPSAKAYAAYCRNLKQAQKAAVAARKSKAVSREFSSEDLAGLIQALKERSAVCTGDTGKKPSASAALAEFDGFYTMASALRNSLEAHSRGRLQENARLAVEARRAIFSLVISSSAIATIIVLLLGWVVYSLRAFSRALSEQHDEILVLKKGIEETPLGVVLTDTKGKIEYVNRAFTEMHGYSFEEAVGKTPGILKSGEMSPAMYEGLWKSLLDGQPWNGELHNRKKSGELVWVRANIAPIRDSSGKLSHFMALHKDVTTEKRLMEEVVAAKHEADRANQAKSDFLAAMSHEIRTPLNAIVGMSELIDEGKLSAEQAQYLSIMRGASDTLLALINDILDISKIEAGKIELENAPFDLDQLTSSVCDMISVRASKKNVEVSCKIDPDVPVHLIGDVTRLRQVLMNLMGNAVKFVDKGWISLSVSRQRMDGDRLELLFSVQDTGIGIPRDKAGAIFDKFTQADSSTTRKYGGTGLGLPISRMLIELMGGKIWVDSDPGEGATFYFTVKVDTQKDNASVYLPKTDIKELRDKRFLVVDDNHVNRIIIREIAHSWGASCEMAPDGESGLAMILDAQRAGKQFHGVFVDFNMPGIDGLEFCRRLASDYSVTPRPAIAIVTSDTVRFRKEDFVPLGITTFIMKPVKKQSVLEGALRMLSCETSARAAAPKRAGDISREDLPDISVLIADDSQDNRVLMSSFLKNSRIRLTLAENGRDALEKFRAGSFDIVFMDMQMPEMDGFEASAGLRELEKERGGGRVKLVALTAMAMREDVDRALKAGCDDYLTKPIRKQAFYSYLVKFSEEHG